MNVLRSILDGKRVDALSQSETRLMVQECAASRTLVERARQHLYVLKGLQRKIIAPDVLLPIAISEVKSTADLTMVALALRFGANRNLYLMTSSVGAAHIIVYTVVTLKGLGRDTNLILSVILVLMIMGSQTISPAFDQSGRTEEKTAPPGGMAPVDTNFLAGISEAFGSTPRLPLPTETPGRGLVPSIAGPYRGELGSLTAAPSSPEELRTPVAPKALISVQDWLRSQGLPPFADDITKTLSGLKKEVRIALGTITDRPDVAIIASPGGVETLPNLEDVLAARATQIIKQYPTTKGMRIATQERGEYIGLVLSVEAMNSDAFIHFVDLGLAVTYFTINRLVLQLRSAFREGDTVMTTELQTMLQYAVDRGAFLDMEQLAIISTTDDALAQSILAVYRQPQWKKVCAGPSTAAVPDSLRTLAFTIGLDSGASKERLCASLLSLSEADVVSLKNAAILRQKARAGSEVSTISEFISGSVPSVSCSNKTVLQQDPFEYNDAYMTFYKDNGGQVWCFTSNMYESLLATPVNPYTSEPLPERFQSQIRTHLDLLRRLGISPSNPMAVTTAIDSLSKPDDVSGTESAYIVDTILQSARVAGIDSARIQRLTPAQMNTVLATIGMDRAELTLKGADGRYVMTPDHQFITFCRAAYHAIKLQPDQARIFFNNIKLQPVT